MIWDTRGKGEGKKDGRNTSFGRKKGSLALDSFVTCDVNPLAFDFRFFVSGGLIVWYHGILWEKNSYLWLTITISKHYLLVGALFEACYEHETRYVTRHWLLLGVIMSLWYFPPIIYFLPRNSLAWYSNNMQSSLNVVWKTLQSSQLSEPVWNQSNPVMWSKTK